MAGAVQAGRKHGGVFDRLRCAMRSIGEQGSEDSYLHARPGSTSSAITSRPSNRYSLTWKILLTRPNISILITLFLPLETPTSSLDTLVNFR